MTFGLLFMPWNPAALVIFAAMLALASGGPTYLVPGRSGKLRAIHPANGGAFYLALVLEAVLVAPSWEERKGGKDEALPDEDPSGH